MKGIDSGKQYNRDDQWAYKAIETLMEFPSFRHKFENQYDIQSPISTFISKTSGLVDLI